MYDPDLYPDQDEQENPFDEDYAYEMQRDAAEEEAYQRSQAEQENEPNPELEPEIEADDGR